MLLPLISALVAGDIVANEDGNGTLKTILTRSVDRGQVFAAKSLAAITYAALAVFLSAAVATIAGVASWGFDSITTFSGTVVSASGGPAARVRGQRLLPDPACSPSSLDQVRAARPSPATAPRRSSARSWASFLLALIAAQIPGLEGDPALPADRASSRTPARPAAHARPTGRRSCALRVGLRAVRRRRRCSPRYLVFLRRDVAGELSASSERAGAGSGRSAAALPRAQPTFAGDLHERDLHVAHQPTRLACDRSAPLPRRAVDSAPQATPKRTHWSGGRPS